MTCTKVYMYMENGVAGRRDSFTVAMDMDIHGYLCVDIRLRTATEVIGPISGIRIINNFTIVSALKTQTSCCY